MRRLERAFRVAGFVLIALGGIGAAVAIIVLALTAFTDRGTDEPSVYVVLFIVALSQLGLGAAAIAATRPTDSARR